MWNVDVSLLLLYRHYKWICVHGVVCKHASLFSREWVAYIVLHFLTNPSRVNIHGSSYGYD